MIFLSSIEEHIEYLKLIFDILININIYLSSYKSFFDYSLMHLFEQKVDALNFIIVINKLITIFNLIFSKFLNHFKKYLDLIKYLR